MLETVIATLEATAFVKNGFVIGKFRDVSSDFTGGDLFSAKGNMIRPELGMKYKLTGFWENNSKFGPTLLWKEYEIVKPDTYESIVRYLKSLLKGILSDTIITRIVEVYKQDAVDMIKNRYEAIILQDQVKGAKKEKLEQASNELFAFEDIEQTLIELNKRLNVKGLPKNIAMKIYDRWGVESLSIMDENPYRLTEFKGIGFLRADRIALGMGFDVDSIYRKKAALLYILGENESVNGCTIIERDVLASRALDLLDNAKADLGPALLELKAHGEILVVEGGKYFQLAETERDEKRIAYKLVRILFEKTILKSEDSEFDEIPDNELPNWLKEVKEAMNANH